MSGLSRADRARLRKALEQLGAAQLAYSRGENSRLAVIFAEAVVMSIDGASRRPAGTLHEGGG